MTERSRDRRRACQVELVPEPMSVPGLEARMEELRRRYPELSASALARIFRLPESAAALPEILEEENRR